MLDEVFDVVENNDADAHAVWVTALPLRCRRFATLTSSTENASSEESSVTFARTSSNSTGS